MFEWLRYGHDSKDSGDPDKDFFFRREFSFTKANDVYIRYLSFQSAKDFAERVKLDQPHKIDIGAVYSLPAKDHNSVGQNKFRPTHREMVFDVDFTDYEEVLTPSPLKDAPIWSRNAWLFMACAIKVVDAALREDFGYEHLLWVFSGRRGVHCWVCDDRALALEDNERSAIVDYLSVVSGAAKAGAEGNGDGPSLDQRVKIMSNLHPAIKRALKICYPLFLEACVSEERGQGLLATKERWEKVLKMIPDVEKIRDRLSKEWESSTSSSNSDKRWAQLEATVRSVAKTQVKLMLGEQLLRSLDAIVLFHIYPRLDVNVSTHRNHLLKSPFVIHPKTGSVCVPIFDVENAHTFNPYTVPNLKTLIEEIDAGKDQTSLAPIVEKFQIKFLGPLKKQIRNENRVHQEKIAAVTGNW